MEGEGSKGTEPERFSDHFRCPVCLDILYKPIVLTCGHASCFWCCQKSMNWRDESHCPLCRQQYHHFPAICQTLHFLLRKSYPVSYNRRKAQTLEDERRSSYTSPDIDNLVTIDESNHLSFVGQFSELNCGDNSSAGRSSSEEEKLNEGTTAETCNRVSIADVLCAACKKLLFQPVVLNCGHVYCEACITIPADGMLKCQVCECGHPSGFPNVCKGFDQFLKEQFSSEYDLRTKSSQLNHERIEDRSPSKGDNRQCARSSFPSDENFLQWWAVNGSKFHPRIGCDACGMFPIIGHRYNCKDCTGDCSYDLCGDCYSTGLVFPGRYNQKHSPQHKLELEKCTVNKDVIYRLLRAQQAIALAETLRNRSNPATGSPVESPSLDDNEDGAVRGSIESPSDTRDQK